jgi:hypothetical protein
MWVWCIGTERRTTRIPAKVVEFIASVRHLHTSNDLPICRRTGIDIHHRHRIRAPVAIGVDGRHVGQSFWGSLHGHFGRGIKRRIGLPQCHDEDLSCRQNTSRIAWFTLHLQRSHGYTIAAGMDKLTWQKSQALVHLALWLGTRPKTSS